MKKHKVRQRVKGTGCGWGRTAEVLASVGPGGVIEETELGLGRVTLEALYSK